MSNIEAKPSGTRRTAAEARAWREQLVLQRRAEQRRMLEVLAASAIMTSKRIMQPTASAQQLARESLRDARAILAAYDEDGDAAAIAVLSA